MLADKSRLGPLLVSCGFCLFGLMSFAALLLYARCNNDTLEGQLHSSNIMAYDISNKQHYSTGFIVFSNGWLWASNRLLQWAASTTTATTMCASGNNMTNLMVWCALVSSAGFGINGPKALLQLRATEQSLVALEAWRSRTADPAGGKTSTGTVSGVMGLCAQVGASCSGMVLAVYVQAGYAFLWPSLTILCTTLLVLLLLCSALDLVIGLEHNKSKVD